LGPWGIPLALELDDFEVVDEAGEDFLAGLEAVVAGAGLLFVAAELVVVAAGVLLVEEEELLLPQPAAMTPATSSATSGSPRANLDLLIIANLCCLSSCLVGTFT
jgi:hypothetical protein